jgi:hypothetical protein
MNVWTEIKEQGRKKFLKKFILDLTKPGARGYGRISRLFCKN